MMKQERQLVNHNLSGLFGTGKLAFMAQVSFTMALLINGVSIVTLSYANTNANATTVQYTPDEWKSIGITTPMLQDVLTWIQVVSATYLLIANIVLHLPVVYKKAVRDRVNARQKLNLNNDIDSWGWFIPIWAVLTDFMFVYQTLYLLFAIMSILFTL